MGKMANVKMKTAKASAVYDRQVSRPERQRGLEQEVLLVSATELICQLIEQDGVSRAELARRIGKSKAFVTQLLRGSRNITLRTLADVAWALGARIELSPSRLGQASRQTPLAPMSLR